MLKAFQPGMGPKPAAAQEPVAKPAYMSDAEWSELNRIKAFNDKLKFNSEYLGGRPAPAAPAVPRAESPYDIVGGGSSGGLNYTGRPRWEVERDRQKAEMELENQRLQMEYQRWMIEQMKRNPYGMNVRDLLSRIK